MVLHIRLDVWVVKNNILCLDVNSNCTDVTGTPYVIQGRSISCIDVINDYVHYCKVTSVQQTCCASCHSVLSALHRDSLHDDVSDGLFACLFISGRFYVVIYIKFNLLEWMDILCVVLSCRYPVC